MLLALRAPLHPAHGVHGARPTRPRMQHQAGEEWLLEGAVRQLLGRDKVQAAPLELVAAHVADLRDGVLVGHAEVEYVGAG